MSVLLSFKKQLVTDAVVIFLLSGCSSIPANKGLDRWSGAYSFAEEPIEAGGGNVMVMDWNLQVNINDTTSTAVLEVNGQTTYQKIKAVVSGDSTRLNVLFENLIDGSGDRLKKNDTLFLLKRTNDSLLTEWRMMRPVLRENQPAYCNCFN